MRLIHHVTILALAVVVMVGCKPPEQGVEPLPTPPPKPVEAEAFTIPSLAKSGGEISLADHEGSVVLLDFWATWCPPCRAELPALNRMYEELKGEGFAIIGMTVDRGSLEQVAAAVERFGLAYPLGLAGQDVQDTYGGIRAVPTKFLLDRKGVVRNSYVGLVPEAQLKSDIEQLLGE